MTAASGDADDPREFTRHRDDVIAALGRLAEGTFARCDICGVQISDRRLRLAPAADRCEQHLLDRAPQTPAEPDTHADPTDQPDGAARHDEDGDRP
ncbi:TraR/DksA C4-type zinc finger protein [Pseudonocardia endophytica]|uniref:Uncharacterized protein n=1 Tax=Pseudonocardia endophytica TaxID=401976 RepID=A0A4R1HUH4_PSEEN|nr:TraR/DksA C4-type zinc finger protein [Pseudonocardia endophytica]TCK21092.1 hypothetical protein EV378_5067 [Pseudonocardia endophytica]